MRSAVGALAAGWSISMVALACANGSDPTGDPLAAAEPASTQDTSTTLPPSQATKDAGKSSSSSSTSSTSSSSSSTGGTPDSGPPDTGTSTSSSSSGGAGGDCPSSDPIYYLEALTEASGPNPQSCPCPATRCCYSGLVCVDL